MLPFSCGLKNSSEFSLVVQNKIVPNNQNISGVCNHLEASNYHQGIVNNGELENCHFLVCTDEKKDGFNQAKITEYSDYITAHGGMIQNDEDLCGDDKYIFTGTDYPFPTGYSEYHTYKSYVDEINNITQNSGGLAHKIEIGKSSLGLPIMAVRVSNNDINPEEQTSQVYVGTHHAREILAKEIPLRILKDFVENAKTSSTLKAALETKTIYFIPLLNPDGTRYDLQSGQFAFWRKNARPIPGTNSRGTDLNRNYDNHFDQGGASDDPEDETYHGPYAFSEPETQAFRDFIIRFKTKINLIISYHSFSQLVLYPYGGVNSEVPGPNLLDFKFIANKVASITGYTAQKASSLYIATGDTCDWAYDKFNIFCFTIELTPTSSAGNYGFYPKDNIISSVLQKNYAAFEYLFQINDPTKEVP